MGAGRGQTRLYMQEKGTPARFSQGEPRFLYRQFSAAASAVLKEQREATLDIRGTCSRDA